MGPPIARFTKDELRAAGLGPEEITAETALMLQYIAEHPETSFTLAALQRLNSESLRQQSQDAAALPDTLPASKRFAEALASTAAAISAYGPDAYERTAYYYGLAGDYDHPDLVYRSDFRTTPFPRPTDDHVPAPVKSAHGAFGSPLNRVWETVRPQVSDLLIAQRIAWVSIGLARFSTYIPPDEDQESFGPTVIWIGVSPGSTSPDTAHEASGEILALLQTHDVQGVVVEWYEAVAQWL